MIPDWKFSSYLLLFDKMDHWVYVLKCKLIVIFSKYQTHTFWKVKNTFSWEILVRYCCGSILSDLSVFLFSLNWSQRQCGEDTRPRLILERSNKWVNKCLNASTRCIIIYVIACVILWPQEVSSFIFLKTGEQILLVKLSTWSSPIATCIAKSR